MKLKDEIKKLIKLGKDPKEVYQELQAKTKNENECHDLAIKISKTPVKNKQGDIFNFIYIALIIFATFFEIYSLFSSEALAHLLKQAFKQQVNMGNETFSTISVDDFLHVFRAYVSVLIALVTGIITFLFIKKNLLMYRVLYVSNLFYAILITIISLLAMVKIGFSISEIANCILCYLLVFLNYKIIKLYFPYLNIVFGLRKNKEGKFLIQN